MCTKDEKQEKLSNVQNIVEKKNTMPILSHFLLDAGKNGSYIVATDLETAIKEPVMMKVEEQGKLCIPARKLFEIVREIDGDLSLETLGESAPDGGWLQVKAGTSEFKLACLSANEFPAWPAMEDEEEIIVDSKALMEMIEKTIYSAGESDTRYTLNSKMSGYRDLTQVPAIKTCPCSRSRLSPTLVHMRHDGFSQLKTTTSF